MNDLVFATASELASAIRRRQVSALEVVEAHLAHIARHNPRLNAIVTLDEAGALGRARAADQALAHGEMPGALHGVPITLEDAHATAGMRSTWGGLLRLRHHVPSQDSVVAERLKSAGAILLGKTNGPTMWQHSLFGDSRNPWDVERTPGGTAGGPAAAVAAGLSPLDVALDTTGSILNPAHYCGVFGLRPTEGRVPLAGVFFVDVVRKFRVMSVAGPLARSVDDLRLALQIIAGPDRRDPHVPPVPWRAPPRPAPADVRMAWAPALPGMPIAGHIRAGIERLAGGLRGLGVKVEECLPELDFVEQAQLGSQLYGLMDRAFEPRTAETPPGSLNDYLAALQRRDGFMARWDEFFAEWDALLCPVGPATAPRHDEGRAPDGGEAEGSPIDGSILFGLSYYLSPVSGCPAVVVPAGRDGTGLPFGVQIVGQRWSDERLLEIAQWAAELGGGFQRPPGY